MTKSMGIICLCALTVLATACVKETTVEQPAPLEKTTPPEEPAQPEQPAGPSPRVQASSKLTEQGSRLLDEGQPDKAMRVLEQAISLDPNNGRNYYYMAEAWLTKEIASEAQEFNQLAEMHLKGDDEWIIRVAQQADRIAEMEK